MIPRHYEQALPQKWPLPQKSGVCLKSGNAMIPKFGPCKGHHCDFCRICKRGRCCGEPANPQRLTKGVNHHPSDKGVTLLELANSASAEPERKRLQDDADYFRQEREQQYRLEELESRVRKLQRGRRH